MCQEKEEQRANCCRAFNRQLQLWGTWIKYGIPFRNICDWVLEYQGRNQHGVKKRKRQKETGMKVPAAIH